MTEHNQAMLSDVFTLDIFDEGVDVLAPEVLAVTNIPRSDATGSKKGKGKEPIEMEDPESIVGPTEEGTSPVRDAIHVPKWGLGVNTQVQTGVHALDMLAHMHTPADLQEMQVLATESKSLMAARHISGVSVHLLLIRFLL